MTADELEAWVLHKRPSGDTSIQVTFFTRERGIVKCLCKGGRAPKKQALLQAFSPLWLVVDARKDWHYSRQIESLSLPLDLQGYSLFAGLYVNELLYYSLNPLDAQPQLFDVYLETLQALVSAKHLEHIELLLRRFEWCLLRACGQAVSLSEEAHSGRSIEAEKYYRLVNGEGFVISETGLPGQDILAFSKGCLDNARALRSAKLIMRQAIDNLLDNKPLKSRALFSRYHQMKRRRNEPEFRD
ncbi:DNA repair protein RecO [Legionella jordanis]|uniref:DNA repair protein RecO n=1 Tax=Legionella jordanis TaxID=456 RepID=A0A0W0V8D5_9GAMM|nr:DNA repair protein RecO [Legionella jordanis]KTD16401.1 DNA repair protein RecO [Legionella jordanis]RMX04396.1 DNA repair protein RecO [Legionella jordanis]RMX15587.1 DNA repair protein RecO [Legionella jordanis]VEH12138.1 DNA repair protein RecO (recombination protein O) [Legionella jordanis]HAT8714964.1 DNA repair protein RecO [Legionella jordanis]